VAAVAEADQLTQIYLSDGAVSRPSWPQSSQALGIGVWTAMYRVDRSVQLSYQLVVDNPQSAEHTTWERKEWLPSAVTGLGGTLGLARGWDTYDAAPVSERIVQRALGFLLRFLEPSSPPPAVVPLSDGGVQMEWHRGGLDIEVTFSPREAPEMYVRDIANGNEWEGEPTPDLIEQVRPLLVRLRDAQ